MQKHLQRLINLISQNDLKALLQHYLDSSEAENVVQLGFMFQQGQIKTSHFDYFQQLATSFIEVKGLPIDIINKIKTNNTLSFFTPALQIQNNFAKTDHQQRNVLHYLFSNNQIKKNNTQPPFNYIRSMMLFGSNKGLTDGLCQREKKSLTPIEVYLFTHKNLAPLVNHELTALFALIEIEDNQQSIEQANYLDCIQTVSILCKEQAQAVNHELQRIILIATYYKIAIKKVVTDIANIS